MQNLIILFRFSSVSATPYKSLVYTECWGLTKVMNNGVHVGYAAACGSGVEPGCDIHTGAIKTACQNDVRNGSRKKRVFYLKKHLKIP